MATGQRPGDTSLESGIRPGRSATMMAEVERIALPRGFVRQNSTPITASEIQAAVPVSAGIAAAPFRTVSAEIFALVGHLGRAAAIVVFENLHPHHKLFRWVNLPQKLEQHLTAAQVGRYVSTVNIPGAEWIFFEASDRELALMALVAGLEQRNLQRPAKIFAVKTANELCTCWPATGQTVQLIP